MLAENHKIRIFPSSYGKYAAEFGKVGLGWHCIVGLGFHSGRHSFHCIDGLGREWLAHYFSGIGKLSHEFSVISMAPKMRNLKLAVTPPYSSSMALTMPDISPCRTTLTSNPVYSPPAGSSNWMTIYKSLENCHSIYRPRSSRSEPHLTKTSRPTNPVTSSCSTLARNPLTIWRPNSAHPGSVHIKSSSK